MPRTVEEIKKQVSDADTAAAVAALEAQVNKARAYYANINKNTNAAAREGAARIAASMNNAGMNAGAGGATGLILQSAAGNARTATQNAQRLAEMGSENNIRYVAAAGQKAADDIAKANAQQKAATLAKYGDFSGYGEIGYTPEQVSAMKATHDARNAKTEQPDDYEGLGNYAQTLLDLYATNAGFDVEGGLRQALENGLITERDYQAALIASGGIIPGYKNKKTETKSGNARTSHKPDDSDAPGDITQAEQAAANRVTSTTPEGKYIVTDPKDWDVLMGYYSRNGLLSQFAQQFVFKPQQVVEKVYVPGYGEITWEEADALEQAGNIIAVGLDKNGKTIYAQGKISKDPVRFLR